MILTDRDPEGRLAVVAQTEAIPSLTAFVSDRLGYAQRAWPGTLRNMQKEVIGPSEHPHHFVAAGQTLREDDLRKFLGGDGKLTGYNKANHQVTAVTSGVT